MPFNFNPTDGLLNIDMFPTEPVSETAARQQFMTLFNQVKDHMNNNLLAKEIIKKLLQPEGSFEIDGLIIKWGVVTVTGGEGTSNGMGFREKPVAFPTPFPNGIVFAVANSTWREVYANFSDETVTGGKVSFSLNANTWPATSTAKWFAVGH